MKEKGRKQKDLKNFDDVIAWHKARRLIKPISTIVSKQKKVNAQVYQQEYQ